MDSVTQITLGAAVGEAVLGRHIGNRAILWGAIIGTLPDLDVFVPLGDAVSDFTYHRSASHSLFVLALVTPLLVWIIGRIHPTLRVHRNRWLLLVYLVFVTHVLLDSFTAYGTQIFWPLSDTPIFWSTIFIIDPLYTLPLLAGVIAALVMSRDDKRGHRWNHTGLVISTWYLAWTVVASVNAESHFKSALQRQNIEHELVYVSPGPFNSLLWRAVAIDRTGYYEGWFGIFDRDAEIRFTRYPSRRELLVDIEDQWPVQRLQWFSHGIYKVEQIGQGVVIGDLRMGIEPNYVFRFKVGEVGAAGVRPVQPELLEPVRDWSRLPLIWDRIRDASVVLSPAPPD